MMSTQSKPEHGAIQSSSIGLLRERFRQLERVKEMRENKELLRMFCDYKHTNNNNTNQNSPIIVSTSTNSTTTTSTITRDLNNNNIDNNNNIINNDNNNNINDELQIFIPPNYMSNNNPNASCYSSPLLSTTSTISSLSSYNNNNNNDNNNNNNNKINLNDISLTLWPPMAYNNQEPKNSEELLSTMNILGPVSKERTKRPRYCAYKMEESHHVSDVDTTLHL